LGSKYNYENPRGETVWINHPNEKIYFSPEDGSYIEIPFIEKIPIGAMVHYGELENHTAVTTATKDRYRSKNGQNPLVYHNGTAFAGFDGEDTQIYIRSDFENIYDFWTDAPPPEMEINGPGSIPFGSPRIYTVANLPAGSTVTWYAVPAHLVNITTSGNSAGVSPKFNSSSTFTLYAKVSGISSPLSQSIDITANIPDFKLLL